METVINDLVNLKKYMTAKEIIIRIYFLEWNH